MSETRSSLVDRFQDACTNRTLIKCVLSAPQSASTASPTRQTLRLIDLKEGTHVQWSARSGTQEIHKNRTIAQSLTELSSLFPAVYQEANLLLTTEKHHWRARGGAVIAGQVAAESRSAPVVAHNRAKQHLIPEGTPCAFLEAIGVMTSAGQVRARMVHKFHQINRFLELVNDIVPNLPPEGPLRVVDFGSGKSYLTFAMHHLLAGIHQREVQMLAVDQNAAIIETCRGICQQLQWSGIEFQASSIASVKRSEPVDLAVALHACDGATDLALQQAVRWQARVILAVPCCQHEVARVIQSEPLDAVLRHGILKERFAALATDALRVAALESVGYRTQILEFVDLDHTPKNLLIRAVRRCEPDLAFVQAAEERYRTLKSLLGMGALTTDLINVPQSE